MKGRLSLLVSRAVILLALAVFIYPSLVVVAVAVDPRLRQTGQSRFVPGWFESAAKRYSSWAGEYLDGNYASTIDHENVAGTEWPLFGSVLLLLTAEELQRRGQLDLAEVREAVDRAAAITASPVTATWVREKWGETYLEKDNIFYRMLLLMGLSSYESITGDCTYLEETSRQRKLLSEELLAAPFHLADDYPDECYPCDVLWAAAAVRRAEGLAGAEGSELPSRLMEILDGPVRDRRGLPAYQADSRKGTIRQEARGSGNSGILSFAAELDAEKAREWYEGYELHYWDDRGWIAGFREFPRGDDDSYTDVDSGPVIQGLGSVASLFGIGAARSMGRMDHAVPLTMETVALAWPSPFGFLLPAGIGRMAAGSASLGEVAMLFSMTRPPSAGEGVPFRGSVPAIVWGAAAFYFLFGALFIGIEIRHIRKTGREPPLPR